MNKFEKGKRGKKPVFRDFLSGFIQTFRKPRTLRPRMFINIRGADIRGFAGKNRYIIIGFFLAIALSGVFMQASRGFRKVEVNRESAEIVLPVAEDAPGPSLDIGLPGNGNVQEDLPDTADVNFSFVPQHTNEQIGSYVIELSIPGGEVFYKESGEGNSHQINLGKNKYYVNVFVEGKEKPCSLTQTQSWMFPDNIPYLFDVVSTEPISLRIPVFPYVGLVNVLIGTDPAYPVDGAKVEVVSEDGGQTYYETTTDSLGRALVYTINPTPQYLRVSYKGHEESLTISDQNCLWKHDLYLSPNLFEESDLEILVTNKTGSDQQVTVSVARYSEAFDVKDNSTKTGPDDLRNGAFSLASYSGEPDLINVGASSVLFLKSDESMATRFSGVPEGAYYVYARSLDYWQSPLEMVDVSVDHDNQIDLVLGPTQP